MSAYSNSVVHVFTPGGIVTVAMEPPGNTYQVYLGLQQIRVLSSATDCSFSLDQVSWHLCGEMWHELEIQPHEVYLRFSSQEEALGFTIEVGDPAVPEARLQYHRIIYNAQQLDTYRNQINARLSFTSSDTAQFLSDMQPPLPSFAGLGSMPLTLLLVIPFAILVGLYVADRWRLMLSGFLTTPSSPPEEVVK